MSARPKSYKPYVLKNSRAPIPASTRYYHQHKFPRWRHESTSSSDSSTSTINSRFSTDENRHSRVVDGSFHEHSAMDVEAIIPIPGYDCDVDPCRDDSSSGGGTNMLSDQHHSDASTSDEDTSTSMDSDDSYGNAGPEDCSIEMVFENLVEFLGRDDTNRLIDTRFLVSKAEVLFAILAFSIHYKLPNDGVEKLCCMINSFLHNSVLPQTKYFIDKLFCSEKGIEYHAVCPKCKVYVGIFTRQDRSVICQTCNYRILLKQSYRDFFVTFDIAQELRELVEANSEYYISVVSGRRRSHGKLRDFHDGRLYLNFVENLPEELRQAYVTLLCNCDGAALYKGTKFSLWPIWVIPNEIPIRVRNSQPIPAAFWYGHDKPNMTYFLNAFVERINKLSTVGFSCRIGDEVRCIRAFAICFCVDCMARYAMQGGTIFHGYYSCAWCLHRGVLVPHKTGKAMKFPIMNQQPLPRTEPESLWHIRQALQSGPDNFGFQSASPLLKLEGMIITDGFVPDHMHQVDLGATKQLTDYRIEKRGQPFSFTKRQIALMDEYLTSLKVPSILERLTRSIYERKIWNSREWENWLLYYSLPILIEIEGYSDYVKQWEFLVGGVYIILKDEIDFVELETADKNLRTFLFMTEVLYSRDAMSYNIHQTGEHLVQSVANWGPAWAHSGYPFEAGNGDMKKKVKASNGVIHQLNRCIFRGRSLPILKKHIENSYAEEELDSPVLDFYQHLKNKKTTKTEKVGRNRYFGRSTVRESSIRISGLTAGSTFGYNKLVRDECVFQKWTKRQSRSDDSFVMLSDGSFIKILQFLHDSSNGSEVTLCRRIRVMNIFPNAPQLKKIITIDNDKLVVDTNSIVKSCAMIEVNDKRYICPVPNMHFY